MKNHDAKENTMTTKQKIQYKTLVEIPSVHLKQQIMYNNVIGCQSVWKNNQNKLLHG